MLDIYVSALKVMCQC